MGKFIRLSAAAVLAATATTVFAGTASAHTPDVTADCTKQGTVLMVKLTAYDPNVTNTVAVTDGDDVLLEETEFGATFEQSFTVSAEDAHTFVVDIKAGDDPTGEEKWTRVETRTTEACIEKTTTTKPTETDEKTTTVESTTEPSSTETTAPESTPAPPTTEEPSEDELADTGASIAVPLGLGALLLVGGVAALILVRRRANQQ